MPAEAVRFSREELPELLFFDTSFILAVVFVHEVHHEPSVEFLARLKSAAALVVVSPVLRLEYFNGWRRAMVEGVVGRSRGADESERRRLFGMAQGVLDDMLAHFRVREVRLTESVQDRTVELMKKHNLQSLDAVNVAAALEIGCRDIVSLDDDFRRVEGVRLWMP
ncbi:MAG: type II toxin-antitoxin system VapC family toxin [Dehalococcoidia bacterium]|nr:type II toxin-antitoxin system VapC family toxin [Dehalococcoidia bacterium]